MNMGFLRYGFVGLVLIIPHLACSPGHAGGQDGPAIDWRSPLMSEIEREWRALRDAPARDGPGEEVGGKVEYDRYVRSVDRLLRLRLPARRLRELVASPKIVPMPEDQDTFDYAVLTFMIKAFVDSGDRQSLVDLLAKRCPGRIEGPEDLEFYLAYRGKKLKDPILILGEAYARSKVPETRRALAGATRRAFAGLGFRGKDDSDFVDHAMRWYEREKTSLIVNPAYTLNETFNGGLFTIESYEKHPEFYDNPPQARSPLFKKNDGPRNLGEKPDRSP